MASASETTSNEQPQRPPPKSARSRKTAQKATTVATVNVATQKPSVGQSGVVIHLKVARGEPVCDPGPLAYDGLSNASAFAPPLQAGDAASGASRQEPSFLRVVDLLKDFENKNEHDEWPSCTSIACYWCCHAFNGPPMGIPVKLQDGRYSVVGCFCSLECAAKYNFEDASVSMDDMFERNTLINTLAAELRRGGKDAQAMSVVRPAPPRLALTMFGGQMSIDEFRAPFAKFVDINFPPMNALTLQIEEINQSDVMYDFKYIPLDNKRISNYLRRSKPIFDHKNTLDYTMKLKVESSNSHEA
jgi:hypothetical protein